MAATVLTDPHFHARRRTFLQAGMAALVTAGLPVTRSSAQSLQKVSIIYPTTSQATWPFWIAQRAGYYAKYGLDVTLKFGVHPAGMASVISGEAQVTNSGLEQVLAASLRDPALVMFGSSLSLGSFVMVSQSGLHSMQALRGKRIGVGRVGDTPYFFTVELLGKYGIAPNQVQWVSTGTDAASRASMLVNGQLDAALITAPNHERLLATGNFRDLTYLMEHPDIPITTVYVMKKTTLAAQPQLAESLIKANAEAIKRFYEDKGYAVQTYREQDKASTIEALGRVYDLCANHQAFERIPVVRRTPIEASTKRLQGDLPAIRNFDFSQVVDNGIVRRLAAEGWFERLYGPQVKEEQNRRLREGV